MDKPTPIGMSEAEIVQLAKDCGAQVENLMTNPPRPLGVSFSVDQLVAFATRLSADLEKALLDAAALRAEIDEYEEGRIHDSITKEGLRAELAKATAQGMLKAADICEALPDRQYSFPLTAEENNRELARDAAKLECAKAIRSEASRLQPPAPLPESAKENSNESA